MSSYTIKQDPAHHRLTRVTFSAQCQQEFQSASSTCSVQESEYVPFQRFRLAALLSELTGDGLRVDLQTALRSRRCGAVVVRSDSFDADPDHFIKFATAISHLIGVANYDQMSGTFYARFTVKHTDDSDSYLRQAYRPLTLHTDGAYTNDQTEWVLMMKLKNDHIIGGQSRITHLDDWSDLDYFAQHPVSAQEFLFQSPPSKNVAHPVRRKLFTEHQDGWEINYIDQFIQPETRQQAEYLWKLSDSLETCASTITLDLSVGDLILINNRFWLHGRAAFKPEPNLHRELLRQRGRFVD